VDRSIRGLVLYLPSGVCVYGIDRLEGIYLLRAGFRSRSLFAAAREEHVSFNQIHSECGGRIKQQIFARSATAW